MKPLAANIWICLFLVPKKTRVQKIYNEITHKSTVRHRGYGKCSLVEEHCRVRHHRDIFLSHLRGKCARYCWYKSTTVEAGRNRTLSKGTDLNRGIKECMHIRRLTYKRNEFCSFTAHLGKLTTNHKYNNKRSILP